MDQAQKLIAPFGRLLLSLMFILAGYNKIGGYTGTQGYMEAMGIPGMLLPLVIAVELLGGLALLVGWNTRIAAFLLAGFTLVANLIFHNLTEQMQSLLFMKNLSIAGGLLMVTALGAGAFSVDSVLKSKKEQQPQTA
ncbi:DoxX family protein [Endozoicomonas lisbonensis]|uniref:Oxidoreductase n=1 Tax=Endozoicomonas lisbonensis TaxID=3120522 RepID=A0ABV2SMG2_9GAMM